MEIIIDSREQKPLWKKDTKEVKITRTGLKTGDYSLKGLEHRFAIERKSAIDLFGTLGGGHKRFKKELERGLELDYFAILIDESYDNILNKEFKGAEFSKMKGAVIISILFTIHTKYKIPIFFSAGRQQSKRIIKSISESYLKYNSKYIIDNNNI
jgi:ERCC4-type nuclease